MNQDKLKELQFGNQDVDCDFTSNEQDEDEASYEKSKNFEQSRSNSLSER